LREKPLQLFCQQKKITGMNIFEKSGKNLCFCGIASGCSGHSVAWSERLLAQFISVAIVNGLLLYLVCRFYGVS
jgi:hypothetical protein